MADDDTLSPSESTDSDEVRNDDGDTVVDPPDDWSEADKFGMTAREAEGANLSTTRLPPSNPICWTESLLTRICRAGRIAVRSTELPRTVSRCSTLSRGEIRLCRAASP